MRASGTSAVVEVDAVPLLDGARELCEAGCSPGGTDRNLAWCEGALHGGDELARKLLADPQTSGGLLFGVAPSEADAAVSALQQADHRAAVVGRVEAGDGTVRLA